MGRKTARQLAVSCITVGLDDKCFFTWAWQAQKTKSRPQNGQGQAMDQKWAGTCHGPNRDRADRKQDPKKGQGRPKPPKVGMAGLMS